MTIHECQVTALNDQLAKAAGVTSEQAQSVLRVLGIDRLADIVNAANDLYENDGARRAFGLDPGSPLKELTLDDVRLGVKGTDSFVSVVA